MNNGIDENDYSSPEYMPFPATYTESIVSQNAYLFDDTTAQKILLIGLILDKPRILAVILNSQGIAETTVRCRDIEELVSVVLHLPFEDGAVASATIINHTSSDEQ